MKKLKVITYERLHYPLLPISHPLCSNLRALSLSSCKLMYDTSIIGDLGNLEVLSFADCGINRLPSSIGRLKKLKLLDVSRCGNLMIDDGVFEGLIKLEELYMKVGHLRAINFTDRNCEELEMRCQTLMVLEIEFYRNNAPPKSMHFKNLKRFKISMGCNLYRIMPEVDESFRNTLLLKADKGEVLACEVNELFKATEVLCLQVQGINHLGDISGEDDFSNLKFFKVKGCNELVHLVDVTCGKPCSVFPVTEALELYGLGNLEGICLVYPQTPMFKNLRVLKVSGCDKLKYVASQSLGIGLGLLETLEVKDCKNMEEIVHGDDEIIEAVGVLFPMLRVLKLKGLRKLVGMSKSKSVDVVMVLPRLVKLEVRGMERVTSIYGGDEMEAVASSSASPEQPLFSNKAAIPMLENLKISNMKRLKEIWPSQYHSCNDICFLRNMEVDGCDNLVNVLPTILIPQLHYLENLKVKKCKLLKVIFDMNFERKESSNIHQHHEFEQEEKGCSRLKTIFGRDLDNLRYVWRMKGVNSSDDLIIRDFQSLTSVKIMSCTSFQHLFTPSTINFHPGVIEEIIIDGSNHLGETDESNNVSLECESSNKKQKMITDQEMTVALNNVDVVATFLPSRLMPTFQSLYHLGLTSCEMLQVMFDMESGDSGDLKNVDHQLPLLPCLTKLRLFGMKNMRYVWKWKKLSLLLLVPPFHNLKEIYLGRCDSIKYLFSPLMVKLLVNLKTVWIVKCDRMEEIVSNRDDGDEGGQEMTTMLDTLSLRWLPDLKRIGGGGDGTNGINSNTTTFVDELNVQVVVGSWSLCQYSKRINIESCDSLSSAIPCASGQLQKLQELYISNCRSMKEVFEVEGSGAGGTALIIPKLMYTSRNQMLRFPNLTKLQISSCPLLEHVFTYSAVESLKQLKELKIENCRTMRVIVKEDDEEHTTTTCRDILSTHNVSNFPNLHSLTLKELQNLKGFSLGTPDFQWSVLDEVKIVHCPEMMVFTYGHSTTPKLKYICSELGKHILEGDLNFDLTTAANQTQFPRSDGSSLRLPLKRVEQLQFPWSLSNLIEKHVGSNGNLVHIFQSNELLQLQKLEKLRVNDCDSVVEVFEVVEGTNNDLNKTPPAVEIPELREMTLDTLLELRYIWKSHQWRVLEFPNLTKVSINKCWNLEHVFTCSMVDSLVHLQELHVVGCLHMEFIVKEVDVVEENDVAKSKQHVFPSLRSVALEDLRNLNGFCLRNDAFEFSSLKTLLIRDCRKIKFFTFGASITPELKVIDTNLGLCDVGDGLNSFIKSKLQDKAACFGGD